MTQPAAPQFAAVPSPRGQRPVRSAGFTIPLGRWRGVPVSARGSALVVVALFADLLATSALPAAQPGHSPGVYWEVGLLTACVFAMSVLAHELSHALTARHYAVGVRGVTLWMLGGVTEFDSEPASPRAEAVIAAAGPAASMSIGAIAGALAWWTGMSGLAGAALAWLAGVSVVLGVFNLLPGSPLDGGRVLHAFLWWRTGDRGRADRVTARAGQILGYLLIGLGVAELFTASAAGAWLALVGWFILTGASAEHRARRALAWSGLRAGRVMTAPAAVLNDWWSVERVLPELDGAADDDVVALIDFDSGAAGALTLRQLRRVHADNRADTRLRDLARAVRAEPLQVTEAAAVAYVVATLREHAGVAIVTNDRNYPVGIITSKTLARYSVRDAQQRVPCATVSHPV
jgi:Zn-dependent protease